MKPILTVPFLTEPAYIDFLATAEQDIHALQFSLPFSRSLDSRIHLDMVDMHSDLQSGLARLPGPKKYALLNSRIYDPSLLTDKQGLSEIITALDNFANQGFLDGIVYCDQYLLTRLSDEAPDLAAALEAMPGANCMLDSHDKVRMQFDAICDTRFRLPGKILLDRSLNRNLDELGHVARLIRSSWPDMQIELLANEGCLYRCPYKLSHDAYISLANIQGRDATFQLNRELGCVRLLGREPHRILRSPFIRPEDLETYLCHADLIKICGRTLGGVFLGNVISAYRARAYDGNLLDLLDAAHWLAEYLHVDNSMLSAGLIDMLALCDGNCNQCGFCQELFASVTHRRPLHIRDNRATVD